MKLVIEQKEYSITEHLSLFELANRVRSEGEKPALLANVNGKLRELFHHVKDNDQIEWITMEDQIGYETYRRSCSMLFLTAVSRVCEGKISEKSVLHFSIRDGFYFTLNPEIQINAHFLKQIENEMRSIVSQGMLFRKTSVSTEKAVKMFHDLNMKDKEKLFSTRLASRVNIYDLDGYRDYYYGYMVHDTSVLTAFRLHAYRSGVILQMPKFGCGLEMGAFCPSERLFDAQTEGENFADQQGIGTVADLNEKIITSGAKYTILVSEAMMEQRIGEIAEQIVARENVKFVMIAGPSSSGKTTFSQRLSVQLSAAGKTPHYIGVDNYFKNRVDVPLDEFGQKDFESLKAVDVKQFNQDMTDLLNGKEIQVPTFDFLTGKRIYSGETLRLGEDEILVIEGIHCLNDELSVSLPKESKFRIYISALTQVNLDAHNRISTTDGRLIRRIVRDYRTRGYCAANTLAMWHSVRRGEERYIFPFQDQVDAFFNSALPYELAALKPYAMPLLFQIKKGDPVYNEARRLLKFLDYFIGIPEMGSIPNDSILREFIGGGCFRL